MTNGCFGWNTGKKLTMRYDTCSTASDFKTWLSNNNVTVCYQLDTPTYTVINDNYLTTQLNNLQNIILQPNLCYIDWFSSEKPTMTLLYPTNEIINDFIITEDGNQLRTEWGI